MVIPAPGGSDGGRQRQIDPGRFKISLDYTVRFWLKQNKTKSIKTGKAAQLTKYLLCKTWGPEVHPCPHEKARHSWGRHTDGTWNFLATQSRKLVRMRLNETLSLKKRKRKKKK